MDSRIKFDYLPAFVVVLFVVLCLLWMHLVDRKLESLEKTQSIIIDTSIMQNDILRKHQTLMTKEVMSWNKDLSIGSELEGFDPDCSTNPRMSLSVQKKETENDRG